MNDRSATTRSNGSPPRSSSGGGADVGPFQDTTRASAGAARAAAPGRRRARPRAAPRCSRQSVKPPVEAPASRARAPAHSISKWSRAASSLSRPGRRSGAGGPDTAPARRVDQSGRTLGYRAADQDQARLDQLRGLAPAARQRRRTSSTSRRRRWLRGPGAFVTAPPSSLAAGGGLRRHRNGRARPVLAAAPRRVPSWGQPPSAAVLAAPRGCLLRAAAFLPGAFFGPAAFSPGAFLAVAFLASPLARRLLGGCRLQGRCRLGHRLLGCRRLVRRARGGLPRGAPMALGRVLAALVSEPPVPRLPGCSNSPGSGPAGRLFRGRVGRWPERRGGRLPGPAPGEDRGDPTASAHEGLEILRWRKPNCASWELISLRISPARSSVPLRLPSMTSSKASWACFGWCRLGGQLPQEFLGLGSGLLQRQCGLASSTARCRRCHAPWYPADLAACRSLHCVRANVR